MNMQHFDELRRRINKRLEEIRAPHRRAQILEYPWLYGALGEVPSEVMFVCENPSIAGVKRAHIDTVDRGEPDIEAQWWGGAMNPAAKRFRVAIHRLGLKATPPAVKGGWRCYITNVIKEMNVAGDHQKSSTTDHRDMAQVWAPILTWELSQVQPKHVFCVGRRAHGFVTWLVSQRLIPRIRPVVVNHYSARSGDARIIAGIVDVVDENLPRRPSTV
jgi:hypothetical protein